MKLRTKFNLGITIVFVLLAAVITVATISYVDTNTIWEAEQRVRTYTRAAWEIHNSKIGGIQSAVEVLTHLQTARNLLNDPTNESLYAPARTQLEAIREGHNMDILNILAPNGTVLLRTRSPYHEGDSLADDPMVRQAILTQGSISGDVVLDLERLSLEGPDLVELCQEVAGESTGMLAGAAVPVIEDGELIGVVLMGSLLNGDVEVVDRIRDAVFENEVYAGKPVGTATIFLGDLRISTNVRYDQGQRALGTRVSREVAEHVLEQGLAWTGRAFVVDTWYLSQYDPIKDPEGNIIGMLYVGELEQKYVDLRTRTVAFSLSIILAGLVLAFVIILLVSRGILGSIQELSEATKQISNGELDHRVPVRGKDEVGLLSVSFNRMAGQLEEQRREIEQRQRELERLNAELRTVNRNYMEMLGFVSHELKNPLSSAMMSLHTVKDGYLGELNAAQTRSLDSVAQTLDYFEDMIRNYLDLSRLEKGELEVTKVPFSLHDRVVLPVLQDLDRELRAQQMVVDDRIPEGLVLNADANLLRIVYDNLLSNAAKYGREGGAIVLTAQEDTDHVALGVRNDGDGIPPDQMAKLFRKFSRLDSPAYAGKRGTGLGLYICKEIVEKHGGEMWVASEAGEWARFSFTIPK
ncbi:MAG: cache domain-containing protein [Anaerolineae bacterium]